MTPTRESDRGALAVWAIIVLVIIITLVMLWGFTVLITTLAW